MDKSSLPEFKTVGNLERRREKQRGVFIPYGGSNCVKTKRKRMKKEPRQTREGWSADGRG